MDSRSHFHRYQMRRYLSCNSTSTQTQSARLARSRVYADNCGHNHRSSGMLVSDGPGRETWSLHPALGRTFLVTINTSTYEATYGMAYREPRAIRMLWIRHRRNNILTFPSPKSGDLNFNFLCTTLLLDQCSVLVSTCVSDQGTCLFENVHRDNRISSEVLSSQTQTTVLRNTLNCRKQKRHGSMMQRTGTTKANQPISQLSCTHRASQNCNCATTSGELMNAHLSSSLCLPIADLSSCSKCKPSSSLPITNTRVSLSAPNAGSQPSNVP